jgi:hypothetical protein
MTDAELIVFLGIDTAEVPRRDALEYVRKLTPEKRAAFERMNDMAVLERAGLLSHLPKR